MVIDSDGRPFRGQFGEFRDVFSDFRMMESGRQIEIAVVDKALPIDRDHGAAHQEREGAWIEAVFELFEIGAQVTRTLQPGAEAPERNVGKGKQVGEG